jgi:hypothetical protein
MNVGYFDAGVHQKAIIKMQTYGTMRPTLPILTGAVEIWGQCAITLAC